LVTTIGGAASPVLLGVLHDRLGGHGPPLALLAAGSAVAGLLLLLARVDTARGWRVGPRMVPVEETSGP
jgi:cyanate permease